MLIMRYAKCQHLLAVPRNPRPYWNRKSLQHAHVLDEGTVCSKQSESTGNCTLIMKALHSQSAATVTADGACSNGRKRMPKAMARIAYLAELWVLGEKERWNLTGVRTHLGISAI